MVELLIVTKSKDSNNINYSFSTQLDISKDDLAKSIFSSPLFKLSYDSGLTYIAIDDISICRISEITE